MMFQAVQYKALYLLTNQYQHCLTNSSCIMRGGDAEMALTTLPQHMQHHQQQFNESAGTASGDIYCILIKLCWWDERTETPTDQP